MKIDPHIQQAAAAHLSTIQQRPDHEFLPYQRAQFLYETLASYPLVRSHLAIQSAHKVLPIFQEGYSEQKMPARLLRLAERVANGTLDKDSWRIDLYSELAYHVGGNGWGFFDDIDIRAYHAGHACGRALLETLGYLLLEGAPATIPCDDEMIDYTDYHLIAPRMDTASHAAHALADGEKQLDPQKLLAFWTWWLNDALIEAFNRT